MMEWIVSSSALILGVLALRALLRGKISLRLQYALWLLVLVRLLCPANFFQSSLSVQNAVDSMVHPSVFHSTVPENPHEGPDGLPNTNIPEAPHNVSEEDRTEQNPAVSVPEPVTVREIDWTEVAVWVWIAGALLMLAFTWGCNFYFARMIARDRREIPVPQASVPVYVSPWVKTPCLVGLFRPVIYLTSDVAREPDTWDHVIRHEMTHLDHFDHLFSLLRCLALCIHWFNPLVWIAARASKEDCELACDEGTIARLGEGERIRYGETLIRLTCRSSHPSDLMIASTTMMGTKSAIRERVKLIAMRPKTLAVALVVCVVAVGVLVGCTFTGAVDQSETTEPTEPVETTMPMETTEPMEMTAPAEVFTRALPTEGHTDNNAFILEARNFILDKWRYNHLGNRWQDGRFVLTGMQQVSGTEQATADTGVWMFQMNFDVYLDEQVESCCYYAFIWENDFSTDDKLYGRDSYESFGVYDPSFIAHFEGADYLEEYGNPYAASVYATAEAYDEVTSEGKEILLTAVEDLLASGGSCSFSEMEGRYPIAETNQFVDSAVEYWSWIEVDPSEPLPDCFHVEYLPESGGRIRFYDVDYGIVELESGGEIRRWAASSVYRHYHEDLFHTAYDLAFKYCDYSIFVSPLTCEADSYQEACRIMATERIPGRHTAMSEHSARYALEYEVLEYEIGPRIGEDGTWAECWVSYAIRQPELDIGPYGNVGEGTGEWEGWLMFDHWGFQVVSNGDGTWKAE